MRLLYMVNTRWLVVVVGGVVDMFVSVSVADTDASLVEDDDDDEEEDDFGDMPKSH